MICEHCGEDNDDMESRCYCMEASCGHLLSPDCDDLLPCEVCERCSECCECSEKEVPMEE
jgi:hypothetical protein